MLLFLYEKTEVVATGISSHELLTVRRLIGKVLNIPESEVFSILV